ncbi:MAG: hypothetical protein IJR59_06650 [Firmicutes bacterium]|nr:hypothetical protein [Bacillota bacterium]
MSKKVYNAAKYIFITIFILTVIYFCVYDKLNARLSARVNLIIIAGLEGRFYLDLLFALTALSLAVFVAAGSIYKYGKKQYISVLLAVFTLILTAFALFPKNLNSYRKFDTFSSPDGKHTVLVSKLSSGWLSAPYTAYYQPVGRFLYRLSLTNYYKHPQIIWEKDGFYASCDENLYHENYVNYTRYNKGAVK